MSASPVVQAPLDQWIGRVERIDDQIDEGPAARLAATLDEDASWIGKGAPLPPLWHWIYFLTAERRSRLGRDGHPVRGGFLPPVELPRRMWAGSRLSFHEPLRIGDTARRTSTIRKIEMKKGRSGALCFVTVGHEISAGGRVAVSEEQDIVYREDPRPGERTDPPEAPAGAQMTETVQPDPTLLFRYSALTFNGHRIHYDREYAGRVEGYPGLVVHAPLIATLLIRFVHRCYPEHPVRSFAFRGASPLVDIRPFTLATKREDQGVSAWAANEQGKLAMIASTAAASAP